MPCLFSGFLQKRNEFSRQRILFTAVFVNGSVGTVREITVTGNGHVPHIGIQQLRTADVAAATRGKSAQEIVDAVIAVMNERGLVIEVKK